jgi:hypothetical protein
MVTETDKIEIERFRFEYENNVNPNKDWEERMTNTVRLWLAPLAKKINEQAGTINILFADERNRRVYFDNMIDSLMNAIYQQLELYRPLYNR